MPSLTADGKRVAEVLAGVLGLVEEEPREPLIDVNGEQLAGVVKPACGVEGFVEPGERFPIRAAGTPTGLRHLG